MIKYALILMGLLSLTSNLTAMQQHGGQSAKSCIMPSLTCAQAPSAIFDQQGKLWLAWAFGGHIYIQHSNNQGKTYSQPQSINAVPENIAARAENRPKIQLDDNGNIYISWTQSLKKRYTGNIRFSRSLDEGKTFSAPITINDDQQQISHRFDSLAVTNDGRIFISWLDKRDAEIAKQKQQPYLGGALYYTYSSNLGKTFSKNLKLSDNSCVCCRIAMTLDKNNLPIIAWRDIYGDNIRDHSLISFNNPLHAKPKQRLSNEQWKIDGCPHHGPSIGVDSGNSVHASWFNDVDGPHVLFYANNRTKEGFSKTMGFGNANKQSSHPYVLTQQENVYLVWKEFDGQKTEILLKTSKDYGSTWNTQTTLVKTQGPSDHPLLIRNDHQVFLSWHSSIEGYQLVPLSSVKEL